MAICEGGLISRNCLGLYVPKNENVVLAWTPKSFLKVSSTPVLIYWHNPNCLLTTINSKLENLSKIWINNILEMPWKSVNDLKAALS